MFRLHFLQLFIAQLARFPNLSNSCCIRSFMRFTCVAIIVNFKYFMCKDTDNC